MSGARSPPRWPPPARRPSSCTRPRPAMATSAWCMAGDVVLAISNSGESDELAAILPAMRRLGVTLVAMTGNAESTLARHADHRDLQRGRPGGLPDEPGAHRQHHRADGAGRRAGGGAARCARFPRRGLRPLAPRRQPGPQAADARARPDALGQRAAARRPARQLHRDAGRDDRQGPGLHRHRRWRRPRCWASSPTATCAA